MTDVRLKTMPFEYGERQLRLCCNMNVLADLQEDGALADLLRARRTMHSYCALLAAMINEAADAAGLSLRVTARELGRTVSWQTFRRTSAEVFGLLIAAIADPDAEDAPEDGAVEDPKNGQTSERTETA